MTIGEQIDSLIEGPPALQALYALRAGFDLRYRDARNRRYSAYARYDIARASGEVSAWRDACAAVGAAIEALEAE